jgi:hypothetical protein
MNYPDEIIVEKGSSEYEVLHKHSEVFRKQVKYSGNKDEVKLSSKFFGDEWSMFVDLFFPEMGYNPLFKFKNNSIQLRSNRGTKEQLAQLLRFLLVDDEETMMNFARSQALKQLNAPAEIDPRKKRTRKWNVERKYNNHNNNFNNYNNNYNKNYSNNHYNNNNGPKLGLTEEEENLLPKLSRKNAKIYFPNERRRKTRRIKV